MSENREIVEALGEVLASEDLITRMNDEGLLADAVAKLEAVTWADFEFALVTPPELGVSTEFRGVEGFVKGWNDWLSPFETYAIELGEIVEAGDRIVALAKMTAAPKGTSAAIENEGAAAFTFEGGKVRRLEFHLNPEAAFKAAGLDPQSGQE